MVRPLNDYWQIDHIGGDDRRSAAPGQGHGLSQRESKATMRLMAAPSSNPASSHSAEPPYQPLVVVLAAASLGIVADRFWPLPLGAWWAMAVGGLTAWAILARPAVLSRFW